MTERILCGPKSTFKTKFQSLGDLLFTNGEKFGNKTNQIDANIDQSETYLNVKKRSTRVAISLQKLKVSSNDVIFFCSNNTLDSSIPVIASFYIGATVSCLDPTLSVTQTRHLLSLVTPKLIFVQDSSLALIEESLEGFPNKPIIVVWGESEKYLQYSDLVKAQEGEEDFRPVEVNGDDDAVLFFSSGTTGLPKAICHSHQSFLHCIYTFHESGIDNERFLYFTTLYWISGMLILIYAYITGGCRIIAHGAEGETVLKIIEKYKVISMFMAPIYSYALTQTPNADDYDVSSLRFFIAGGTPISTQQNDRINNLFKNAVFMLPYAMSECGINSIFHPKNDQHLIKTKHGSCGRVSYNNTLKIVDPDTELSLGANENGEIRVHSSSLMKGYYRQDSTSCFDSNGFLKTGDIGYYDEDGCVYIVERLKEMFKYRTWHIVPSAIEQELLEHPAIAEAVVFGIPQSEESGEAPAACVVRKDNVEVSKEEILEFLEGRLSDREKLRGGIWFVETLPKTPTGKVIRKEVRRIAMLSP